MDPDEFVSKVSTIRVNKKIAEGDLRRTMTAIEKATQNNACEEKIAILKSAAERTRAIVSRYETCEALLHKQMAGSQSANILTKVDTTKTDPLPVINELTNVMDKPEQNNVQCTLGQCSVM